MKKIAHPAIRTSSGKIVEAKGNNPHNSIPATGQKSFTVVGDGFVGRKDASKIAKKSGQAKPGVGKALHSEQLKGKK